VPGCVCRGSVAPRRRYDSLPLPQSWTVCSSASSSIRRSGSTSRAVRTRGPTPRRSWRGKVQQTIGPAERGTVLGRAERVRAGLNLSFKAEYADTTYRGHAKMVWVCAKLTVSPQPQNKHRRISRLFVSAYKCLNDAIPAQAQRRCGGTTCRAVEDDREQGRRNDGTGRPVPRERTTIRGPARDRDLAHVAAPVRSRGPDVPSERRFTTW